MQPTLVVFTAVSDYPVDHTELAAENKTVEWKGIYVLCWTVDM